MQTANLVIYNEAIKMMGDEIFDLGIENEALRDKVGEVDEKWLNDSKNRIKLNYNDDKRNKYILEERKDNPKKWKQYKCY